jgi:hypothetical protein
MYQGKEIFDTASALTAAMTRLGTKFRASGLIGSEARANSPFDEA